MKLCILAAGKGSRNNYSKILPKGFLPIDNKPGITYVIDSVPNIEEIIVAIGSSGDLYRQFLPILYPSKNIKFIEIKNHDGPGSGPGASLLECANNLNDEFLLIPTDAYIDEEINDSWESNWMGVSRVESTRLFCLLEEDKEGEVSEIYDKDPNAPLNSLNNGFNGIAFIKDYEVFFKALKSNKDVISGEMQVSNGFSGLMKKNNGPGLNTKRIESWADFGSSENYINLISKFKNQNLIKNDEFTYIYNHSVYKYDVDEVKIKKKIDRSKKLNDLVPKVESHTKNFFSYKYVEGKLLNEQIDISTFNKFLQFCKSELFIPKKLAEDDLNNFHNSCMTFYKEKTHNRLKKFWDETNIKDEEYTINGVSCKSINETLQAINWESLYDGMPYNFHGDLQPENIINQNGDFILIDWRETFGESDEIGDIYYDLAKLDHALLLSGKIVRKGLFEYTKDNNQINISFKVDNGLLDYREMLYDFIIENEYDLNKIKILSSLIYLNIAPLYEGNYSHLLYFLGQLKLNQLLYTS